MNPQNWMVVIAACAACAVASAQSPLFEGSNPEAWVMEADNPNLQSIDTGQWLDSFQGSGIMLTGKQQALINNLALSEPPMQPMQPAVSLAGLAQASSSQQNPQNDQLLRVWPESGAYDRTLRLEFGVSAQLLSSSQSLTLNASLDNQPFVSVVLCGQQPPLVAGCQRAQSVRDGYVGVIDHLIETGPSSLTVELRDAANQQVAVLTKHYQIDVDDSAGRLRDSDGDGIPDLIERELGLDPLNGDRSFDRDGDGWSDFDEWLRGATAAQRNDPNWVPQDSDGDGWSDWDEELRGTRVHDPDPQLIPRQGENTQTVEGSGEVLLSESYLQRAQRFREYPQARRLYEVEYLVDGATLVARNGFSGTWQSASAQTAGGHKTWRQAELIDQALLDESRLVAADLAPSRVADQAANALAAGRFPEARFPAADGVMVDLALVQADGTSMMHKRYLPALADADLQRFATALPLWSDAESFRTAYISWLKANLVQAWNTGVDWSATRTAMALELLLSDEARLNAAAAPVIFNDRVDPVARLWFASFLKQLDQIGPPGGLNALATRLDSVLSGAGILRDVADFMDEQLALDHMPVGVFSDVYMAERFVSSFTLEDEDCFVSAAFLEMIEQSASASQQFSARCPMYATEVEAQHAADQDHARRYALRSLLLLEPSDLASDQSLLDPHADSDGDNRNNDQEVRAVPLAQTSQPNRGDSDADGNPDDSDLCPRDLADACLGLPSEPQLFADMEPLAEEGDGALAVVVLHLDRPVSFAISGTYRTQSVDGDTATPDVDYHQAAGNFDFSPGQQVANITIPVILDSLDEGIETFTLVLDDVQGARSTIPENHIVVSIADPDLGGPQQDPPSARAFGPAMVEEHAQVMLDGESSHDPLDQGLRYQWSQQSGPAVSLDQAQSARASFIAPSVASTQTVTIQLTVTDAEQRMDSDVISIVVQPVNDPPEVLGTATFRVVRGNTLNVDEQDLLAYVSDPDGDVTYLEAFLSEPLGGRFSGASTGFEFTPYQGEAVLSEDVDDAQLQRAGSEHAVWLDQVNGERLLQVYSAADQSVRTQWKSPDLTHVVAASDMAVAYTRSSSLNAGLSWALEWVANGDRVELGNLAIADPEAVIVHAKQGDLYYCDTTTYQWTHVDADTGFVRSSAAACSGSYYGGARNVVYRPGEMCFGEESRLYCARDSDVRLVADIADYWTSGTAYPGFEAYALGDDLLVPVPIHGSTNSFDLLRIDARDEVARVGNLPDTGSQVYLHATGYSAYGGLLLGTRTSAGMRLYHWAGGLQAPVEITGPFGTTLANAWNGTVVQYADKAYWYVRLQDDTALLFEIDLLEALTAAVPVKPRAIYQSERSAYGMSHQLKSDEHGILMYRPAINRCHLMRLRPGDVVVEDIAMDLDCYGDYEVLQGGFVYQREEPLAPYHAPICHVDDAVLSGVTSFAAKITDVQGQSADLPIEITIEEAP